MEKELIQQAFDNVCKKALSTYSQDKYLEPLGIAIAKKDGGINEGVVPFHGVANSLMDVDERLSFIYQLGYHLGQEKCEKHEEGAIEAFGYITGSKDKDYNGNVHILVALKEGENLIRSYKAWEDNRGNVCFDRLKKTDEKELKTAKKVIDYFWRGFYGLPFGAK